ncbi:MAG: UDP-2,4-diacetamido-2,4,6-trideoxy-beta-L-altropyranose hydrolase [Eubacterium sp.]|nr:UDP-2,4-diacetamido-2,4,6-trideoxy-beta-L-altropyranose hydrolase [Eubacterium sp.]
MIYIRTDANEVIGAGHVMRCLSIADALRNAGKKICFITFESNTKILAEQRGFPSIVLDSSWNQLEQEIPLIRQLLKITGTQEQAVLVDSYFVTEAYMTELGQLAKVIYIDDLCAGHLTCDLLINYSLYAQDMPYSQFYTDTKLLLGCRYVPLRDSFWHIEPKKTAGRADDILVLTGGSDTVHFALNFVKAVLEKQRQCLTGRRFHIVCGFYNPDRLKIEKLCQNADNLVLYQNISNLREIMCRADIAVSAGGFTLYELCACGTPVITYASADNQMNNIQKFSASGLMQYSGDARRADYSYPELLEKIEALSADLVQRQQVSYKMQQIVDGGGAGRIAEIVLECV